MQGTLHPAVKGLMPETDGPDRPAAQPKSACFGHLRRLSAEIVDYRAISLKERQISLTKSPLIIEKTLLFENMPGFNR